MLERSGVEAELLPFSFGGKSQNTPEYQQAPLDQPAVGSRDNPKIGVVANSFTTEIFHPIPAVKTTTVTA